MISVMTMCLPMTPSRLPDPDLFPLQDQALFRPGICPVFFMSMDNVGAWIELAYAQYRNHVINLVAVSPPAATGATSSR